ncbi:hypothetical protein BTO20_05885 [Mycobacterium dioxanotrophicus]|uniref:Uncharacterized protein n=1 Tax=Mycobacterium dioxanotrophicus TaxID=482462 RepID=A0A1Y0BZ58_9MYCO|nr:hypothetical protein [Mycobacterium dioxanotrophicus]ART68178.1 hypothetical protein BTO20_05885 [Mycobacterium dioxanotrophicus]
MTDTAREKVAEAIRAARGWKPEHGFGYTDHLADAAIAAHLDALKTNGYALVKLPKSPSEYWGPEHQPQWNHYPYTRVDGDEIEIGARCEYVFRANVLEARVFAADVLAAADAAESTQRTAQPDACPEWQPVHDPDADPGRS